MTPEQPTTEKNHETAPLGLHLPVGGGILPRDEGTLEMATVLGNQLVETLRAEIDRLEERKHVVSQEIGALDARINAAKLLLGPTGQMPDGASRAETIRVTLKHAGKPTRPAELAKMMSKNGFDWAGAGVDDPSTLVANELARMTNAERIPVKKVGPGLYVYEEGDTPQKKHPQESACGHQGPESVVGRC